MLACAARGEGSFHADVCGHYGLDIIPKRLSGGGKKSEGIQISETHLGVATEGGILLVAGSVTAVVGDVERLETLRDRGIIDGVELIGVHVVGSPVGILGEEPHGIFLGAEAEAEGHQQ